MSRDTCPDRHFEAFHVDGDSIQMRCHLRGPRSLGGGCRGWFVGQGGDTDDSGHESQCRSGPLRCFCDALPGPHRVGDRIVSRRNGTPKVYVRGRRRTTRQNDGMQGRP